MPPLSREPGPTEALHQSYAAARLYKGVQGCIVILHIGTEQSGVAVGLGPVADLVKLLPMGSECTAREYFKTTPPTPLAVEHAIQLVEDVVMPLRSVIPSEARLFSADAALREIALLAGAGSEEPSRLKLDAMERLFSRLSAVVEGSPALHQGLPESNTFAATLLILREFMHHLQFAQIEVLHVT